MVIYLTYANNSNETATRTFAFTLSRLFSQHEDVVHILPTKRLQTENLYDIVKRISLEEIGFEILSIITDNDSIYKKAISFFCSPKISIIYPL